MALIYVMAHMLRYKYINSSKNCFCKECQVKIELRDASGLFLFVLLAGFIIGCGGGGESGSSGGGESVIYVSKSGDDADPGTEAEPMLTIGAGITAAEALGIPSEVRVSGGLYDESVTLVEGVSLFGGYSTDWALRDADKYTTTIADPAVADGVWNSPNCAICAGGTITTDTIIDRFTIQGGGGEFSSGIFAGSGGAPTIQNNTINGGSGDKAYGIHNYNSSSPYIAGNTINGGSGRNSYGIYNDESSSPSIAGNTIDGSSGGSYSYGIYNGDNSLPAIQNNTINGGSGGGHSYGIYNDNTSSLTITDNIINGGRGGYSYGIYSNNSLPNIFNNTIAGGSGGNFSYGISSRNSLPNIFNNTIGGGSGGHYSCGIYNDFSSSTIYNNAIDGGSGDSSRAIYNGGSSPSIYNNTINGGIGGSYSYGIYNRNATSPKIDNNIVFTSGTGSNYCIYEEDASDDPATFRNNDLFDCDTALYYDFDDDANYTAIAAMETDLTNEGISNGDNISVDPEFVDIDGADDDINTMDDNDWRLTASTDASITTGGLDGTNEGWSFTTDFDGVTRTGNGATGWSMGFSETLTTTTAEPAGANCTWGGNLNEQGSDNGDGGGIANNGILEVGEIDTSYYDCDIVGVPPYQLEAMALVLEQTANVEGAKQKCESKGLVLATWSSASDLDALIQTCQLQSLYDCYTQYRVNDTNDGHISVIDGSARPPLFNYWQGMPLYTTNRYVMVRYDLNYLFEQQATGRTICMEP